MNGNGSGSPPVEDSTAAGEAPAEDAAPQEAGVVEAADTPVSPSPARGTAWVIFGADTVRAELARTSEERQRGLQFRDELAPGTGMLFVFPQAEIRSFWMQDTFIPLDIAYLDVENRILNIEAMEPRSTELHESAGPALFALEVPQGWFAEQGIQPGDRAEIIFGPG